MISLDKLDVRQVISDHWRTLKDGGKLSINDITIFIGFPLAATALYAWFSGGAGNQESKIDEVLVSAFSIFASLLLNIQVFLLGLPEAREANQGSAEPESLEDSARRRKRTEIETKFIDELFANIAYAILISAALVMGTLIAIFVGVEGCKWVKCVQFFLILHFFLTLLMVMKRIRSLFMGLRQRLM